MCSLFELSSPSSSSEHVDNEVCRSIPIYLINYVNVVAVSFS